MPNMTLAIPSDLKQKMNHFKEINWSEVARQAIREKALLLEKMNRLFSKSRLTEEDIEKYGRRVKKTVLKKYKTIWLLELVVDTNVLLAALLKEAVSRELLLDSRLRLFAPEHLIFETQKHLKANSELRRRIRLTSEDLEDLFFLLTESIETVPEEEFASRMPQAFKIAPHREDAPYVALGLALNIPIWSNDKGMCLQDQVRVYSTKELVAILGRRRE